MEIEYKLGDLLPPLEVILQTGASAENLTGLAVTFYWKKEGATSGAVAEAMVVEPTEGRVRYNWAPDDLPTAGTYYGSFKVEIEGKQKSFPGGNQWIVIRVVPDRSAS